MGITPRALQIMDIVPLHDVAIAGESNPFVLAAGLRGAHRHHAARPGSVEELRWVEIEPATSFHEVNVWRDGDEVVVDVCRHPDMFAGDDLGRPKAEQSHALARGTRPASVAHLPR